MNEGFYYKEKFYVGIAPKGGTNIENWIDGYSRGRGVDIDEILDDLTNVEIIKRYPFFYTRDENEYLKINKEDLRKVIKKWEAKKNEGKD